ncbi:MAG: hypothetical protein ACR2IE_16085 [Candidatus Sumerlaeaceae bacterium]
MTKMLYGLNVARWDKQLYPTTGTEKLRAGDSTAIARLKDLELGFLKYPGGNDADSYVWNSEGNKPDDMDTDEYLELQRQCGVPGFFTVNFTSGTQLAAEWARYIQMRAGNGAVPFWEVGDEVWGSWAKSHTTGTDYAQKFRQIADAMRAVEPGLKMAANLHLSDPDTSWTREALAGLGDSFDIITTTFFPLSPPNEQDEKLFRTPDQYRKLFGRLKDFIARSRPGKPLPKFCLVGLNSTSSHPGPQTIEMANAVYMAQMYGAMAETGTDMSCWWAFHNEWKPRGGDFGIVTSTPENRPYHTYYVLRLLAHHFLGRVVGAERRGRVEFYATRTDDGGCTLLVINTSGTDAADVEIRPAGSQRIGRMTAFSVDLVTSETVASGSTRAPEELMVNIERTGPSTNVLYLKALPAYSVAVVRTNEARRLQQ